MKPRLPTMTSRLLPLSLSRRCAKYGDVMSTGSERPPPSRALQRREPRHLLDERRQILGARFGDLIAQREQICIEVRCAELRPPVVFLAHRDARLDLAEQALLLRDDRRGGTCLWRLRWPLAETANLSESLGADKA